MSEINDGGSAFPMLPPDTGVYQTWPAHPGMTLRDYFAGKVAMAIMLRAENMSTADRVRRTAEDAYLMADAMLKAREPK